MNAVMYKGIIVLHKSKSQQTNSISMRLLGIT